MKTNNSLEGKSESNAIHAERPGLEFERLPCHWLLDPHLVGQYDTIFEDFALCDLTNKEKMECVADWNGDDGEWNWERVKAFIPNEIVIRIVGMKTPKPGLGEDKTIWSAKKDGRFRLCSASAYNLVVDEAKIEPPAVWKNIWK
ncbi:unnamed protein product [Linum trigynum]|uniref:Uncharacterized protein n=1 Tax=Linum trigynum TaxID=586398 RepID=A0AAV2DCC0_9ROSI